MSTRRSKTWQEKQCSSEDWNEGGRERKRKTEYRRLIRVLCTMHTICRREKPSDWIAGLVGKEGWEWHLKDKDVLKSSRVWGKLDEDVTGIWE